MEPDRTRPTGAHPFSRRGVVAAAGIAATCLVLRPARSQPASEAVRLLRAAPGSARLRGADEAPTAVWSCDAANPGPVLRVKRGEELRLRLVNDLPEPTCLHWHGVRVPNAMDGVAHLTQAPVAPGTSFDYGFRPPDAGTFWYHPTGSLAAQARRGLRGALIVDETEPVAVDRELILFLEDWTLAPDGTIDLGADGTSLLTINGSRAIELPVQGNERLRLRILNGASRSLILRSDGHVALVVAIDGQPAEPFPARENRVVLAPGNRIDLLVDATLAPGSRAAMTAHNGRAEIPILTFVYGQERKRPAPLAAPKPLPPNGLPERLDLRTAARHDLALEAMATAATAPVHERPPLFSVRRGRVVVLACRTGDVAQAVHLHGHHCRLLDRLDDGWKPFWLDTVMVAARQTDRIAFLADNPGKWLIETQPLAPTRTPLGQSWFEVT
jgi:FtsP/CotA-like multicopper oxidase with cupredoxin domain